MTREATVLQWSLRAESVYFSGISLAHTLGVKIPGLFIYFNAPSFPYQDHIIAFLAFGLAAFYFVASVDPVGNPIVVRGVLIASAVAIAGLLRINLLDELKLMSPGVNLQHFWLQTIMITGYVSWLFILHLKSR